MLRQAQQGPFTFTNCYAGKSRWDYKIADSFCIKEVFLLNTLLMK